MTKQEELMKLVPTMDKHEANAVLSYFYILRQNSTPEVEPDEWEKQVIQDYNEQKYGTERVSIQELAQKHGIKL